jgi:hypothetical protein
VKNGPETCASCAGLAAVAGRPAVGLRFIEAMENAYAQAGPELAPRLAKDLAVAWFNFALAGETCAIAQDYAERAVQRIEDLLHEHNTAEIALVQAKALVNVTWVEPDPGKHAALAQRIAEIRREHNTSEIALEQAKALFNATVGEPDRAKRLAVALRIAALRQEHNTAKINLVYSQAMWRVGVLTLAVGRLLRRVIPFRHR